MDIFKKSQFLKLAEISAPHCVSLYIPSHRVSTSENTYKDQTRFKNRLKDAATQLSDFGLSDEEVKNTLKPGYELLANDSIWNYLSDGLAVFIHDDQLQYYTLPQSFEEFTYVANHLYLKPLVEFLHGESRHFIMALSLGDAKFYEATRNTITPVTVEGLIPQSLEEEVGMQLEEASLQFRSGHGETGESGMYHGHGMGSQTEKKEEALKYFRGINKGLMEMIHDERVPMVVACVDYLYPIYKEANTYKPLHDAHISGNHENTDIIKLKEMAWEVVKDQFDSEINEAEGKYQLLLSRGKAAYNVDEVISGAIIGQAETLFIKRGEQVWGTYDIDKNKVKIDEKHTLGNADLLNKAAVETIRKGGEVFFLNEDQMPDPNSPANAIFRYQM